MMKKTIFVIAFLLWLPITASAAYDQQAAFTYLKTAAQSYWTTQALYQLGDGDVLDGHLRVVTCDSAIDCAGPILGITALGKDPREFASEDLVGKLKSFYQEGQLGESNLLNDDIWGILALVSSGLTASDETVDSSRNYLLNNQNADGGWGWSRGSSDVDDTAAAVMALLDVGISSGDLRLQNAVNYIKTAQNEDGGFPYDPVSPWGTESNANSTALVLSMIYKLGQNPAGADWLKDENNPVNFLASLQTADGSFEWEPGIPSLPEMTTAQAVIALSRGYYPVRKIVYTPPPSGGGTLLPGTGGGQQPAGEVTFQTSVAAGEPAQISVQNQEGEALGNVEIPAGLFSEQIIFISQVIQLAKLSEKQRTGAIIGEQVYDWSIVDQNQTELSEFGDKIKIVLLYDEQDLPAEASEADLQIAYWNDTEANWQALPESEVEVEENKVSAWTDHFTLFAVAQGLPLESIKLEGEVDSQKDEEVGNWELEIGTGPGEEEAGDQTLVGQEELTNVEEYPDGTLIKTADDATVYLIEAGRRRWIPNERILDLRFVGQEIEIVELSVIGSLPEGLEVLYPDGVYLRSRDDGRIYLIKNDKKYHILSFGTWQKIARLAAPALIEVSSGELNKYVWGGVIN